MDLIADMRKDPEDGAFQLIVEYCARLRIKAVKLCGGEEGAGDDFSQWTSEIAGTEKALAAAG